VLQTQTQGSSGTIPGIISVHTDLPGFDSIGSSNYPFAHKRIDTDPLGHVTTYRFDSLNRLTSVTNAELNTRTITYHSMNKVSETGFKGQSTGYVYDSLDCTAPLGIGGGFRRIRTGRACTGEPLIRMPLVRLAIGKPP